MALAIDHTGWHESRLESTLAWPKSHTHTHNRSELAYGSMARLMATTGVSVGSRIERWHAGVSQVAVERGIFGGAETHEDEDEDHAD